MAMVLFVASMTALTSCTKSNAELILGKWSLESVKATYGGTTIEMTIADLLSMYESEEISEDEFIIEFKSDGKVYATGEEGGVNYTVVGDKLTIYFEDETVNITITKLNNSVLMGEMTEVDVETGMKIYMTLNFKRA